VGFGISVTNVGTNMLLQSMAPEALRGRVVSFFSSTRFGFDALGGLLAGAIAARFSPGATLLGEAAVLAVAISYLWTLRRRMVGDVREAEKVARGREG
jgi:MFS family permease